MDDDLMRLFGGEKMKRIMTRIGMQPGEPIYHPMLNRSIEKAQKKVEERNFEIRKHLLEYDDVLNQQRKYIYEQRDDILEDADLKNRVNEATADMVDEALNTYEESSRKDQGKALNELAAFLKTKFAYILHIENDKPLQNDKAALREKLLKDLEQDIADKEALVGVDAINAFIRMQYLRSIDSKWLDHLENMEALREAVYLRGYAQKNPLTEYKIEGFDIFDTMIDTIREEIASRTHLVRIQQAGEREPPRRSMATVQNASHASTAAFAGAARSGGGNAAGPSKGSEPQSITVVRAYPKVGRNDPCPCGSGKKYKYCHGRNA
jgi:preprotein translocase subunit SecA